MFREWGNYIVFIKLIEGKKYYYCSIQNRYFIEDEMFLVQRYEDGHYGVFEDEYNFNHVICYDFDWEHLNVNNQGTKRKHDSTR